MGLFYGVNVKHTDKVGQLHTYSEDELAKINLLTGLYHVYYFNKSAFDTTFFIKDLLAFYKALEVSDLSLWDKLVIGKSESSMFRTLNPRQNTNRKQPSNP